MREELHGMEKGNEKHVGIGLANQKKGQSDGRSDAEKERIGTQSASGSDGKKRRESKGGKTDGKSKGGRIRTGDTAGRIGGRNRKGRGIMKGELEASSD